jgi:nicotinamide-nucleotide amidase
LAFIKSRIITIGDELLIGQTIDTNSAFIAQELNKIGVWVQRRVAVGDVFDDIWSALMEEEGKSDIVIITGGLGPTADDITKPLLCKYFSGKLVVDQNVLEHVKYLFEKIYRRPGLILESNLKQAEVPDTCIVLHNARGSAPGMWFEKLADRNGESKKKTVFISLPGVPHEMKGLMTSQVIPKLLSEFSFPSIIHKTVVTSGQGESFIAELIKDFETALPSHIKLAYLPAFGMVRLRLTATSFESTALQNEMDSQYSNLVALVKEYVVSEDDIPIEMMLGVILKERNATMATAESCTGGYISHLITSIAGSSEYFKGSIVSYANEVKENILGVQAETIMNFGAVSEQTVKEMVEGTIKNLHVDYAVATSGIMGPGGGTDTKPVGMVWVAAGNAKQIVAKEFHFRFDRERNIRQTAHAAMDFLRKFILANS